MVGHGLVEGKFGFFAADFVEVNAPDGDVGAAVAGPARIDVGFGIHGRDAFVVVAIGGGYVSDRVDVGIGV